MLDLLKKAEGDFKLIEVVMPFVKEPWAMQAVMYNIQQAIEKLLKVLILLSGNRYPREHNIRILMTKCTGFQLPAELDALADSLSLWEAGVRYDSTILTTEDILNRCIDLYKQLHNLVLSVVSDTQPTQLFGEP